MSSSGGPNGLLAKGSEGSCEVASSGCSEYGDSGRLRLQDRSPGGLHYPEDFFCPFVTGVELFPPGALSQDPKDPLPWTHNRLLASYSLPGMVDTSLCQKIGTGLAASLGPLFAEQTAAANLAPFDR